MLAVRVPGTTSAANAAFLESLSSDVAAHRSVALADLSFLESYAAQGAFANQLLDSKVASHLDAYASWNTNANTVGTALSEAIAAGAGRRRGTYDELAHRTFTFMRFVDDYAFHVDVRPGLNAELQSRGIDRTLLDPSVAAPIAQRNRALLWNDAAEHLSAALSRLSHRRPANRIAVEPHLRNESRRRNSAGSLVKRLSS